MIRQVTALSMLGLLLVLSAGCSAVQSVDSARQQGWVDWVIPLPKEIAISQKVDIAASDVTIRVRKGAGEVEQTAAAELIDLFKQKGSANGSGGAFEILLGVIDSHGKVEGIDLSAEAATLKKVKNSDQAYVIRPVGDNKLVLAGLNEKGVYYASQTLRQLLEGRFQNKHVSIPLAVVTDWPDLEQRGTWEDPYDADELDWMARYKYNFFDGLIPLHMTEDGRGTAEGHPRGFETLRGLSYNEYCRRHAMRFVPTITHLGHISSSKIYEKHPDLIGVGEHVYSPRFKKLLAPCVTNPKFKQVLVDWMTDLAKTPCVDEIYGWMTEEEVYCSCEKCSAAGQFVNEARVLVAAYREVQKQFPNLKFRICLTQGSYDTNAEVLKAIPHDVGAIYYDGGRTYISDRQPMIYPVLEDYLREGGKVGVVPQFIVSWAFIIPWSCPQFIQFRMSEYVDKGLYLMSGYAPPKFWVYDMNATGAAEWMWNAHGRSPREFARAWATRKGYADPSLVADWAVTLGEASWDVYGSNFPYSLLWENIGDTIKAKTKPVLGEKIFKYFPTAAHFDENIAVCQKALAMAKAIGDPDMICETQIVEGYHKMLKALYNILSAVAEGEIETPQAKKALGLQLENMTDAALQVNRYMSEWGPHHKITDEGRFKGVLNLNAKILKSVTEATESMGVANPAKDRMPPVIEKKKLK